jgi:hypothetical protein
MQSSWLYHLSSLTITACVTLLMVAFYIGGYRLKMKKIRKHPEYSDEGFGAIQGSLLGLLALLLSFTFSMSSSRHDNRYEVMVAEANNIGTAVLRADLFPDSTRRQFRAGFSDYVAARIDQYKAGNDPQKNAAAMRHTNAAVAKVWAMATQAAQSLDVVTRNSGSLMVNALNPMIDSITTRKASRETNIPDSILFLLFSLCLASGFIVGYGSKKTIDWIMVAGFAVMIGVTIFSILDLDRPHRGLITLDRAEQNIIDLQEMLKEK